MYMKLAIIGGTGLLGSNLAILYSNFADVRCFSRMKATNVPDTLNNIINFDNLKFELQAKFESWKPDIIINTVAIVNLNFCQQDFYYAKKINCEVAKILSIVANKYSAYFIQISTDHFFYDNKIIHTERDKVTLLNNYSITKYLAEKKIFKKNKNSLIVRTNIIGFRNNGKDTFFEWLLNNLENNCKIDCYSNYFTSPIEVNLLGKILLKCYNSRLRGIYNISSREVISKYDFALKIADMFSLNKDLITKTELKNNKNLKRALTLGLDVNKIETSLKISMPSIDDVVNALFKIYKERI